MRTGMLRACVVCWLSQGGQVRPPLWVSRLAVFTFFAVRGGLRAEGEEREERERRGGKCQG